MLPLILTASLWFGADAPSQAGSISGCVSDMMHGRVPGTTLVAKGGGVARTAVTDASGCYELNDLPKAVYRVTARLAGFDNVTRDRVGVDPSTPLRLDFTMRMSPICECVHVSATLPERWTDADAVLHMRLSESEPLPSPPQGYYRHAATVMTVLKGAAPGRTRQTFVIQNQRSGAPEPYDVGQELVAFLQSAGDEFRIANDERGTIDPTTSEDPAMVFLVKDGRIQRAPLEFRRYVGMGIRLFFDELRALPRR